MSTEEVTNKLGRFHPQPVDRDRLLFESGRASVRLNPIWKRATVILLLTQMLSGAYIYHLHTQPPPLRHKLLPPPMMLPPADPPTEVTPFENDQMVSIWRLEHNPDALKSLKGYTSDTREPTLSLWNRDYQP